jgi:hypothetical protein
MSQGGQPGDGQVTGQVAGRHSASPAGRHASRLVVYTSVLGPGRALPEVPVARESAADFLCFTDDPGLRSDTWEVVLVRPRLPGDAVRSERYLKIVGHPALAGYDRTLWVDPGLELLAAPETFVGEWLADAHVAAPLHTFYPSVLAEAQACIDLGKDDHLRVFEQLAHYVQTAAAALDANPHWTALLARRRTQTTETAMALWWEHVLRYSRRDQLSFNVAMTEAGVWVASVPLANLSSELHRWPLGPQIRSGAPEDQASDGARRVRAEIEQVLADLDVPDAWIYELEARLAAATAQVRELRGRRRTGA